MGTGDRDPMQAANVIGGHLLLRSINVTGPSVVHVADWEYDSIKHD